MERRSIGEFEHLVLLGILRLRDQAYGVSIVQEVEERTGRDVSQAATYLTLKRLQDKGWIRSRIGKPDRERGGRPKRFYSLTTTGRERLQEARAQLLSMWSGVQEELQ